MTPRASLLLVALLVGATAAPGANPAGRQVTEAQPPGAQEAPPAAAPETKAPFRIPRAASAIQVDGSLDEAAWQSALRLEIPYEVNPGENIPSSVRTEVFLTYDASSVYIGFRAHDPEPKAIRARLSDRDRAFLDDFVGIVVDTFNDERRAFELLANPLGVQMDLVVDDVSGNEDSTWDTIWNSDGRLTPEGYVVEMQVPYTSLRFQRGAGEQVWGLDLLRNYPRDRSYRFALNPRDRNVSCYLCQVAKVVGFEGAEPGNNLEITPTLTAIRTDQIDSFPGGELETGETDLDPGLTARWGITPNLTLSGTVNPDFSQVEADAAQLDVNEQFALFFPEKRPFFLEGSDFFDTPLRAVYTRTVADPSWGAKLTGKEGKSAIGAFVARDEITNLIFPGSQGSGAGSLEQEADAGVFRYRRDMWNNAAIGGLITARRGEGYENDVYGFDALLRPAESDSLRLQALGSRTRYPAQVAADFGQPDDDFSGRAFALEYGHRTRNWSAFAVYVDVGEDFRADLGFFPRVDYRTPAAGGEYIWWGKPGARLSRISAGGDWDQIEDKGGRLIEREVEARATLQGPLQSYLFVGSGHRVRGFRDDFFDQVFTNFYFQFEPVAPIRFSFDGTVGKQVDFAFEDPLDAGAARQGDLLRAMPWFRFNLGRHVRLEVSHELRQLSIDEGRLFRAGLSQMTLAYQMTVRAFFRAILQHAEVTTDLDLYPACVPDPTACGLRPEERNLFSQLLFSYKVNPQTAIFVGYSDVQQGLEDVPLTRTGRTFFVKVGYAWVL